MIGTPETMQKTYYCEIEGNEDNPHFPGYKTFADNDMQAVRKFRAEHGDKLECVYDDAFKIIWER